LKERLRVGSVCSGIAAEKVAWKGLPFKHVFFSEIKAFPSALLAHRYPEVPNLGDFTLIKERKERPEIDILIGGTPCQSFSIGGKRAGLDDSRGNLAIEYIRLAETLRPKWLLWENVPHLLRINSGIDFRYITRLLEKCGYGWAYRILDARGFGVPQNRRRLFLVAFLGDWRPAASVLLDSSCLRPITKESEQKRTGIKRYSNRGIAKCLTPWDYQRQRIHDVNFPMPTLFANSAGGGSEMFSILDPLRRIVRRLTPVESERCQGFPDNYTQISYRGKPAEKCPFGQRYNAIGNSWAVPSIKWIGERLCFVEDYLERAA
jgi:DNA (cytosine-5)-methyltransferase 1